MPITDYLLVLLAGCGLLVGLAVVPEVPVLCEVLGP
jgi:hypothetical protein